MDEWDDWDDMVPEDDCVSNACETIGDVVIFFAKVLGMLLFIAAVVGLFAYGIWREFAIYSFLIGH